jgi:hypothetical protein
MCWSGREGPQHPETIAAVLETVPACQKIVLETGRMAPRSSMAWPPSGCGISPARSSWLGELVDEVFRAVLDEAGIGGGSGVEDDRTFLHDELAVGATGPLGGRWSDLCGRRRRSQGEDGDVSRYLIIDSSCGFERSVSARGYARSLTFLTGGIVHVPSMIEGLLSSGQYIRSMRMNLPAGAGSQFDSSNDRRQTRIISSSS